MRTLVILALTLMALGARMAAAEQVLATVPNPLPGHGAIVCEVVNISTRSVMVMIEILSIGGTVLNDNPPEPVPLAPGFATSDEQQGEGDYCKFIVTQGHAKDVRGAAIFEGLKGPGDGYDFTIPAQ